MMQNEEPAPFVSVKFGSVGRVRRFLLGDVDFAPSLQPGEGVVVDEGARRMYATVVRTASEIAVRPPAVSASTGRVVSKVFPKDVAARLKHQHRERESNRVCAMKIKERGLAMKLVRTEQRLDRATLIFISQLRDALIFEHWFVNWHPFSGLVLKCEKLVQVMR